LGEGVTSPLNGDVTELTVTSVAELDDTAFATLLGNRAGAGEGLDGDGGGEAVTMVAKLDEESRGEEIAGARERVEDGKVGVLGEKLVESVLGGGFGIEDVEEEIDEENGFLLVGQDNVGVRRRLRELEFGEGRR